MTKELNTGEPVSYACQIVEADFETNIIKIEMLDENYKISAGIKYLSDTHPVKELTDEEIMEVANDTGWSGYTFGLITFAKEILRKAQK